MRELPHTRSCFVCGESNPLGLNLRFRTDESRVCAQYTARPEHIGFHDTIHGGITSTLLDELMAWACAIGAGRFAYCVELNVRFKAPIRPGAEVMIEAELAENKKGRIYVTEGTVRSGDTVCATATGRYLPIPEEELRSMKNDFVGDYNQAFKPPA